MSERSLGLITFSPQTLQYLPGNGLAQLRQIFDSSIFTTLEMISMIIIMANIKFSAEVHYLPDAHQYLVIYFPKTLIEESDIKPMDRLKVSFTGGGYIHCALKKDKQGRYCIYLGKFFRDRSGIKQGQEVELTVEKDESDLGMEMPIEMEEVLAIDEEAHKIWNDITPGRKRSALYFIIKAKQEETRIKRALLVAENLKLGFINPNEITRKH